MKPQTDIKLKFGDGKSGLCWNPNNQKKTVKIILPNKYTTKIRKIEAWKGDEYFDTLKNAVGNEYGNRERYYGSKKVAKYPKNLTIFVFLRSGKIASVTIKDPSHRYD